MRYLIATFILMSLLAPRPALAKRTQAAKVKPVIYKGVRYTAPNDDGRRGYVQAWDTKTNKILWEVTVYRNHINPLMEEDVQWVIIKNLSVVDGELIVVDERTRSYGVDTKTRAVKRLKNPPKDGTQANKILPPGEVCAILHT
jgi:hypothetical protein